MPPGVRPRTKDCAFLRPRGLGVGVGLRGPCAAVQPKVFSRGGEGS